MRDTPRARAPQSFASAHRCSRALSLFSLPSRRALYEAWDALNAFMLDKLSQHHGVSIASFAKWTWQFTAANSSPDGEVRCRPVFALTETFARAHKMPIKKPPSDSVAPCSEVNHSVLALRYTRVLTKDMVFIALRDIMRKIGDKIANSGDRPFAIKFSIGALRAIDRKVSFEFDMEALAKGVAAHQAAQARARAATPASARGRAAPIRA